MAELTLNEKRLLAALAKEKKADAPHVAELLDATPEAVVQWGHLAEDKGLVKVERIVEKNPSLTEEGIKYRICRQLPETQILNQIKPGTTLADLQKNDAFKIGFGQLRKKGLVKVEGISVIKMPNASTEKYNKVLLLFNEDGSLHVDSSLKVGKDRDQGVKENIKQRDKSGITSGEVSNVKHELVKTNEDTFRLDPTTFNNKDGSEKCRPEFYLEKGTLNVNPSLTQGGDRDQEIIKEFIKRGILAESETVHNSLSITPAGTALVKQGLDLREEIGTLTRDQILSGAWKTANLRRYDIKKLPKTVYPGKSHPYQRLIDEMRQILLEMGFTEMHGEIVQSAFWNFDALFQPQDHPAREMQDTFYLKEESPLPRGWECLRDMHEHGGDTSSTGWGGKWNPEKAQQCVLRTHTTSLSIQYLATHPEPPVKAFCIGRVYRRESIDPTHTPEFEQLEGIVMDKGVTFRHLLGFLKEFYQRMGFLDVRFRPGFFPYTEPSVEPEIWVDGLGWVEMGGAGVFRQEVTAPWGVTCPVLAWGLGVSRVAMLRMGLKDLRQLYQSDLEWIRSSPVHSPAKTGRKA